MATLYCVESFTSENPGQPRLSVYWEYDTNHSNNNNGMHIAIEQWLEETYHYPWEAEEDSLQEGLQAPPGGAIEYRRPG